MNGISDLSISSKLNKMFLGRSWRAKTKKGVEDVEGGRLSGEAFSKEG